MTSNSSSRWNLNYTASSSASTSTLPPSLLLLVPDPPGYRPSTAVSSSSSASHSSSGHRSKAESTAMNRVDLTTLRAQKAWDIAIAPAKNVPMQAFMMYMTGGGVQIFSVMSVWFLLKGAIAGMLNVQTTFAAFTTDSSNPTASLPSPSPSPSASAASFQLPPFFCQKSTFVLCQFALLLVGLWKCNAMGLLPTHESDWLAFRTPVVWQSAAAASSASSSC